MTLPVTPAGFFVTVVRQAENRFGDFTDAGEHQVGPCGIDYTASTEPAEQPVDVVTRLAVLYAPAGSDITPTDRLRLPDGTVWQVVGYVAAFSSPLTGWNPGLSVRIQKVMG